MYRIGAAMLLLMILAAATFSAASETETIITLQRRATSKIPAELVLPDLGSVTLDATGNVFALAGRNNGNECFVVKFDQDLNYLGRFGRSGEGPGEFQMAWSSPDDRLSIDMTSGDVYVQDYNPGKLVVFDNSGSYKEDIFYQRRLPREFGSLAQVKVLKPGVFLARRFGRGIPPEAIIFAMESFTILTKFPLDGLRIEVNVGTSWITGVSDTCYGANDFMEAGSDCVVFGNSQKYRFQVYDRNAGSMFMIEDPTRKMGSFHRKELRVIGKRFEETRKNNLPLYNKFMDQVKDRKNVIADIKVDRSRIYIFLVKEDISAENRFPVEIYDMRGKIVKRARMERVPDCIRGEYAYLKEYDEDFNPYISKYRILMEERERINFPLLRDRILRIP